MAMRTQAPANMAKLRSIFRTQYAGCLAIRPLCRTRVKRSRNSSPAVEAIISPKGRNNHAHVRRYFLLMVHADRAHRPPMGYSAFKKWRPVEGSLIIAKCGAMSLVYCGVDFPGARR